MSDEEEVSSNRDYTMKSKEQVDKDISKATDDKSKNFIRTLARLQDKFKDQNKQTRQDNNWIWFYVNSGGLVCVFQKYGTYSRFMDLLNDTKNIKESLSNARDILNGGIKDGSIIKENYLNNNKKDGFKDTLKSYGIELNDNLTIKDTVKFQQKTVPQKAGQRSTIVNSDQLRKLNPSEIADFIIEATPVSSILACIIDGLKDSKNKNIDVSGISRTALEYLERAGDLQEDSDSDSEEPDEEEEDIEQEEVEVKPLSMIDTEDLGALRQLISQLNAETNKTKRKEIRRKIEDDILVKYGDDIGLEDLGELGYKGFGRTSPQSYRQSINRNFGDSSSIYGLQNGPAWSGVYPMSLKVTGDFPNLDLLNNRGFMAFGSNKRGARSKRVGMRTRKLRSGIKKKLSIKRPNKRSRKLSIKRSNKRSNKLSNKIKGFRSNKLYSKRRSNVSKMHLSKKRSGKVFQSSRKLSKRSSKKRSHKTSRKTSGRRLRSKARSKFGSFVAPLSRTIL